MTFRPLAAAALLAGTLPAAAQDFSFHGAELSGRVGHAGIGPLSFTAGSLAGSVEYGFESGPFVQIDKTVTAGRLGGPRPFRTGGIVAEANVHLGHAFSESLALGVFGGLTLSGLPARIRTIGLEGVARLGPVRLEAYGAKSYLFFGPGLNDTHLDIAGSYDLGNGWSLDAGAHAFDSNLGLSTRQVRAGASYQIAEGLSLSGALARTRTNLGGPAITSVSLTLRKTFGRGTTFGARDQASLLMGGF